MASPQAPGAALTNRLESIPSLAPLSRWPNICAGKTVLPVSEFSARLCVCVCLVLNTPADLFFVSEFPQCTLQCPHPAVCRRVQIRVQQGVQADSRKEWQLSFENLFPVLTFIIDSLR